MDQDLKSTCNENAGLVIWIRTIHGMYVRKCLGISHLKLLEQVKSKATQKEKSKRILGNIHGGPRSQRFTSEQDGGLLNHQIFWIMTLEWRYKVMQCALRLKGYNHSQQKMVSFINKIASGDIAKIIQDQQLYCNQFQLFNRCKLWLWMQTARTGENWSSKTSYVLLTKSWKLVDGCCP